YGGWCGRHPPKQSQISNELWHVLARSTEASCRNELLQVYCAYNLNKTGGCVPPMYLRKPKSGSKLRPGILPFNFKALPTIGHRPDLEDYKAVRKNPNAAVIPVKFAFLIIAHTCEDCVLQLIDLVYRPYFFYVVHVDFRQDQVRNELKRKIALIPGYTNVRVLPKERSFTATWGSYNILRAELEGIEELARMGVWDFVINLSGSDLPFTDVDDLAAMYASYRTRNFINARETWKERSPSKKDISVWHACGDHVYNVTSRGPPPTWSTQLSASQWFILDRGFATTVIDQNHRSRRLNKIQFFQQTCIVPDESYLSSMLFNSAFRNTYVFDHSRLYRFPKSPFDKRGLCKHSSDIDYCGQSPINIAQSNIKLFKYYSRIYNFGRKHPYNISHPTRKAAINTVRGMDMYHIVVEKKSVTKVFIR
ncbi:xylosyltransferase 2-like, partial [Anneissia japonica]|uniref:xylosyltransferase 2-like n=1 Tax=Anneissia japonica TaxID=1529436 RepID=UPI0014259D74